MPKRDVLEPISDLEFFPELHRYRYKGRWLPFSVTKVANRVSERQERMFRETQHIWEPRGTSVHAHCESLLKGNNPVSTEYIEWTEQLDACWLLKNSEPIAVEYRICDSRKGVGGSFDFLLRTENDKVVLGDLKTVGSIASVGSRKPANAQLGGYLSMLIDRFPNLHIDWCYTLVVGPGRTNLLQSHPDECLLAWVDAWDIFRLQNCSF